MSEFRPTDVVQVEEILRWAASEKQSLEICGGGTKRAWGRPSVAAHLLNLNAVARVIDYDPAELVLTATAGTPMSDIELMLEENRQMWAFEPPDWRSLWGSQGSSTIGGAIACNVSGPRRICAGAARDHFLGFTAINGRGERWKSGGKVVKNVTGYDMCKLQSGAFGTLSVLLELSLRVVPKPDTECSVGIEGLADAEAIALLSRALNSPHEVSAAAHLPEASAARSGIDGLASRTSLTIVRVEGPLPSVRFRAGALQEMLRATISLEQSASRSFWKRIGQVQPLLNPEHAPLWRICTTPSAAPAVLKSIQASRPTAEGFYDWAGGLLWLEIPSGDNGEDAHAPAVRRAVASHGGHATLIRAPDCMRTRIAVFQPEAAGIEALKQRIKQGFDPHSLLNPGRLHEAT